jgi:ribosomal protein L20A (L18A)
MCLDCQEKEKIAQIELKASAESRVKESRNESNTRATLTRASQVDQSIQIIQDIFNAETVAIVDIKSAIDSDTAIVEKHMTLAKVIEERHSHFQDVISAARDTMIEAQSKQRAIQQYYNDLANKLRIVQRAEIKLKDVNYKIPDKKISKPKAPSIKKFNKAELIKVAGVISKEFPHIPANLIMPNLQSLVISRNMNVEQAANVLRGMFGR